MAHFEEGQGSTYVVTTMGVMTTQLGREGRQLAGGYWGVVMKEPHNVLPILEWEMMKMVNNVMGEMKMPCLLRTFVPLDEINAFSCLIR